jgi:hypothetical protein
VCLRRFMIVSILSSHQRDMTNTHSAWITSRGPCHRTSHVDQALRHEHQYRYNYDH